jgi:hypothetical protein
LVEYSVSSLHYCLTGVLTKGRLSLAFGMAATKCILCQSELVSPMQKLLEVRTFTDAHSAFRYIQGYR